MKLKTITLLLCFCLTATSAVFAQEAAPAQETPAVDMSVLDHLKEGHPRLMLTDERLAELKELAKTDEDLQHYVEEMFKKADKLLEKKDLEYAPNDRNTILWTSRDCMDRAYTLGLAYRWSGEQKYYDSLIKNLRLVCAFPDWGKKAFLDTAEMTHAVSIGYDWLYNDLSEEDRTLLRESIISMGLDQGLMCYSGEDKRSWWVTCTHNWNMVCNSGMVIGALAVADTDPKLAATIINNALESYPLGLREYGPDGAWPEGPGYWAYATDYVMYGLTAMDTALGTDFGLLDIEGVDQTAYFAIYSVGPIDYPMFFADCGSKGRRKPTSNMFWLAGVYADDFVADYEHKKIDRMDMVTTRHIVWYEPAPSGDFPEPALDKMFRGLVDVAFMRSAWNDRNALFIGIKAGKNTVNHAHLDLGNFELDALGERWSRDLGTDSYSLPGYWSTGEGGQRWTYFRPSSFSHSIPTFDGKNQIRAGVSEMVEFVAGEDNENGEDIPFAKVDLSEAYGDQIDQFIRGAALVADRRAALVQDEIVLNHPTQIDWGMTTDAVIAVDGATATLTQDGKVLHARILEPEGAVFSAESAEQEKPQATNEGVSRLMIHLKDRTGTERIAVLFSPVWPDGEVESWPVTPLQEW
ncbi:DUF4962 domain-containing protein [Ruficoccus sp. ZRK36]|uniref:DUF4962 domain-containing protein n=1 Tax=Ruficoccus sp. ZRK36 TaxID=2866311 RepID=UPI001C72A9AF|nr:DUF4962 domain-containing protein [Ruficoccus sp. ZRK36]QYY34830.1 DUF4962 domain-containing protein [Ruficoccus sp. ZRK36]